jgi:LPXTG-motif cell wall-anchored protein
LVWVSRFETGVLGASVVVRNAPLPAKTGETGIDPSVWAGIALMAAGASIIVVRKKRSKSEQ